MQLRGEWLQLNVACLHTEDLARKGAAKDPEDLDEMPQCRPRLPAPGAHRLRDVRESSCIAAPSATARSAQSLPATQQYRSLSAGPPPLLGGPLSSAQRIGPCGSRARRRWLPASLSAARGRPPRRPLYITRLVKYQLSTRGQ